jgi:hypothetical protein
MVTLEAALSGVLVGICGVSLLFLPSAASTAGDASLGHERRFKAYKVARLVVYALITVFQAASFTAHHLIAGDGFGSDDIVALAALAAYAGSTVGSRAGSR